MLAQEPNDSGTRGSILLMGSVTATDPSPEMFGTHAYAAAKGATIALMTTMAATYVHDRIRVNAVAPVADATRRWRRGPPSDAADPRLRRRASSRWPARCSDPVEVAHAAVYFLSDESRVGDRAGAEGRRRLVRRVGLARGGRVSVRPDRPRRHRPVRARASTYAHEHLVIDGGRPVEMCAGLRPVRRRP